MPYDKFLFSVLSNEKPTEKPKAERAPEEIEADFLRLVEISKRKEG